MVEDWELATKLWEYSITSRLTGHAQRPRNLRSGNATEDGADVQMEDVEPMEKPLLEHPLLMTEPAWNTVKAREKMIEIAMEDWGCPAFWLGKTAPLAA